MKKSILSKICTAATVLILAGCASVGADFDMTKISKFKEDVATKSEILSEMGPPVRMSKIPNGQTELTWQFVTKSLGSSVKSKMATALFDKQDKLISITSSEASY